jgi:hypothetical protein
MIWRRGGGGVGVEELTVWGNAMDRWLMSFPGAADSMTCDGVLCGCNTRGGSDAVPSSRD